MAIAESMASGLPVVASNVGGVPAMVSHDVDGLLFECGNVQEIANHLIRLFDDGKLRERLSRTGREKAVSVYTTNAVASATVEVYKRILGRNK